MASEPVMFQGKWIETDNGGTWWVPDELIKEIQDNPPAAGTLFGVPVVFPEGDGVIADLRQCRSAISVSTSAHPANCHNGMTVAESLPNRDPVKHPDQCPMTRAALSEIGLTRRGACPTIRNPRKAKS